MSLHERIPAAPLTPEEQMFKAMLKKESVHPQNLTDFYLNKPRAR
jgi:hypothetical protein